MVLPGAERLPVAAQAARRAAAPLTAARAQKPCDIGLFSDDANQTSLF